MKKPRHKATQQVLGVNTHLHGVLIDTTEAVVAGQWWGGNT